MTVFEYTARMKLQEMIGQLKTEQDKLRAENAELHRLLVLAEQRNAELQKQLEETQERIAELERVKKNPPILRSGKR